MKRLDAYTNSLIALLLGGFGYRIIVAAILFPGFDEAYYYLYSRHLNWSYFDHPPLVALTTGLGYWLTGMVSPLTIRLGALVLYELSLGLLWAVGRQLFSAMVGNMAAALASLIPLFTLGFGVLTSPDNGLILFWSATLALAAWEFFPKTDNEMESYQPSWRLSLFGLTVGLACLSKYHGFVLGLSLVAFCLASRLHRRALRSPWLIAALLMWVLVLFPLGYWNIQHDWLSLRFQLSMRFDGGGATRFSLMQLLGYGFIHIVYLFPTFGLPLWWVSLQQILRQIKAAVYPALAPTDSLLNSKQGLILWLSLPITLGFTILGGFQQILPAWPAPGFWGLTLLLAYQAEQWRVQHPQRVQRWLWGSGAFLAGLSAICLLHITTGTFQKNGQHTVMGLVSVNQDPSIELINVWQLQEQLAQSPSVQKALQETAFIFTNEYYLGGYIAMAVHPRRSLPVTCFSQDPRGFAFWFDQYQWLERDALYMTLERFDKPAITDQYRSHFEAFDYIGAMPLYRGGIVVETFHLYRGRQFKHIYNYPYP